MLKNMFPSKRRTMTASSIATMSVDEPAPQIQTNRQKIIRYIIIAFLFIWWLIIFLAIIFKGVHPLKPSLLSVSETNPRDFKLPKDITGTSLYVMLHGPFAVPNFENELSARNNLRADIEGNTLNVRLQRIEKDENDAEVSRETITHVWTLAVVDRAKLKNVDIRDRSELFNLKSAINSNTNSSYVIHFETNVDQMLAVELLYDDTTFPVIYGLLIACILLIVYYILLIFDIVHRTLAAMLVCSMAVGMLGVIKTRPSFPTMISWLTMEIYMIQFGMTLVVTILLRTGIYDWVALHAFRLSHGHIWPLMYVTIGVVSVLAILFENILIVLLIGPFLLLICQMMEINPVPGIIIVSSFLIIGKIALPYSSILNRRICIHPHILENNITASVYVAHSLPFYIYIFMTTLLYLRYVFRSSRKIGIKETEADALKRIINLLDETAHAISGYTKDEKLIRKEIEEKTDKLGDRLKRIGKMPPPSRNYEQKLEIFQNNLKIRSKPLLITCIAPLAFIFILSLYNLATGFGMVLGWITVLAGFLIIIIIGENDFEELLFHVDWCTLVFLACHQILTHSLHEIGLTENIGMATRAMILSVSRDRLLVALIAIYWMSSFAALLLDTIQIARVFLYVLSILSLDKNLDLPLKPQIWAMIFGLHVGSTATQISSNTCIVLSGLVERHGIPFTFLTHLKICFPLMLINNVAATIYLILVHIVFGFE